MAEEIKEKKVSRIKIKKKRWFPIFGPNFLGRKEVGESYLEAAEEALGRLVKINLKELSGNIRDQNVYVALKIKEAKGNNLETEAVGYAYMPFFVKRLVRKEAGKIEDSFVLKTKDEKAVRLKPLATTVFSVNHSVKTAIRKKIKERLKEEGGKLTFENLMDDLIKYRLQMEIRKDLNKICPIREMIVREMGLEKKKDRKGKGEKEEGKGKKSKGEESGGKEGKEEGEGKEKEGKGGREAGEREKKGKEEEKEIILEGESSGREEKREKKEEREGKEEGKKE